MPKSPGLDAVFSQFYLIAMKRLTQMPTESLFLRIVQIFVAIHFGVQGSYLFAQADSGETENKAAESSPDALLAYNDAANFQNNDAVDLAEEAWIEFLQEHGDDPKAVDAQYNLGVCQLQLKKFDAAITTLTKLANGEKKYERRQDVLFNLGSAFYSTGLSGKPDRLNSAHSVFQQLINEYPKGKYVDQSLFFQGESRYLQGNRVEAAKAYKKLIDEQKDSSLRKDAMYALGVSYEELGNFAAAGSIYDSYLAEFSTDKLASEVQMRKAETILRQGNFAEGEKRFAEVAAIEGFAMADHAIYRQAFCVAQQNRFKDAADLFATLTTSFPKSRYVEQATMAAGRAYFRASEFPSAANWFDRILANGSVFSPEAAHWRARIFLDAKQADNALQIAEANMTGNEQHPFYPNLQLDRADALFEMKARKPEALEAYAKIAQDFPDHAIRPQVIYNAAFAAMDLGDPKAALQYTKQFLDSYQDHPLIADVKQVAAESELKLGNNESAAKLFDDVAKSGAKEQANAAAIRKALAFSLEKKYSEAIESIRKHAPQFKAPAELAEAFYILGVSYAGLDQNQKAETSFLKSLESKSDFEQADQVLLNLSKVQKKLNKLDEAIASARRVTTEFPNSEFLHRANFRLAEYLYAKNDYEAAIQAYDKVVPSASDSNLIAYSLYGRGWSHLRLNRHKAAIDNFTTLLDKHADHKLSSQTYYARAMARQQTGEFQSALDDLSQLKSNPEVGNSNDVAYLKGLCQAGLKQLKSAATTFSQIIKSSPDYASIDKVYYELAWIYKNSDRNDDATTVFERLVVEHPESSLAGEASFHVAEQKYKSSDFASAIKHYRNATERPSNNSELSEKSLYKLGWAHYQLKQYEDAAGVFRNQVTQHEEGSLANDGQFMIGECFFKLRRYDQALKIFETVQDKPMSSPRINALAMLHGGQAAGQQKNWDESIEWFKRLQSKYPKSNYLPTALYEMAWANQNQGRLNEALKLYKSATSKTRSEVGARARFMIGEILYANKQYEKAIREFQKVMYGYGAEKASPQIKRWQAKAGFEAGQCAGLLASQTNNAAKRDSHLSTAKKLFTYVIEKHPQSEEAAAAQKQLARYAAL